MYWNYRIIEKYHKDTDSTTYHIHEVFYDSKGNIEAWTEPIEPMGETLEELRSDMNLMLLAFEKPVLTEKMIEASISSKDSEFKTMLKEAKEDFKTGKCISLKEHLKEIEKILEQHENFEPEN